MGELGRELGRAEGKNKKGLKVDNPVVRCLPKLWSHSLCGAPSRSIFGGASAISLSTVLSIMDPIISRRLDGRAESLTPENQMRRALELGRFKRGGTGGSAGSGSTGGLMD